MFQLSGKLDSPSVILPDKFLLEQIEEISV